nr:tripartite motif-containing protein 66-like isoform X2 [Paramormyrops kingsleyae]
MVSLCSVQLDTAKVTGNSAAKRELWPAPELAPPRQNPDTPKPCSVQPDLHLVPLAHQSIERSHVPVTTTCTPPSVVGPHSHPPLVSPFHLVPCPPSVIPHHSWTKTPMVSLCSVQLDTAKVTGNSAAPCGVAPASPLMLTSRTLPMPLLLTSLVNVMVPMAPHAIGLVQNVKANLEKGKTFHAAATQPKHQAAHAFSQITTPQSLRSADTPAICVGSAQTVLKLSLGDPYSALSVKALADSPCERLPKAVGSPEAKQVLPASENEPTSTVMEADMPLVTEDSVTEGTASSQPFSTDERLATQVTAPMSTDIGTVTMVTADNNTGVGNAVIAATVTGADSETAVLIEHPTIMTAESRNKIVASQELTTDSGNRATVTLIDMPVANTTAGISTTELTTDVSSVGVNMPVDGEATEANRSAVLAEPDITTGQHLSQANGQIQITASACGQIPSPTVSGECKPNQNFTISSDPSTSPSSFREAPEGRMVTSPQADSLSPGLGQQKMSEGVTSLKDAKVGSPPSSTQVKLEDESFMCPLEGEDDSGETNLDSGRIHAYSEPVDRCLLPCVSLTRIPIPIPPPGRPLPRFYVVPGTKKNEILLQIMEEKGQFSLSLDSVTVSTCLRAPPPPPVNDWVRFCAVCRVPGAAIVCSVCSYSFHRKCHIPSVNSETSSHWQCMLCRDFSDVGDQYCSSVDGYPSLSLLEQRRCEHVLLMLLCETYSSALYQPGESTSSYSRSISIMSIQGRLSWELKPPYRTPSQFVTDVRLLFGILKSSKESSKIAKLQSCFEKTLFKVFGKSMDDFPKYAFRKKPEAKKWVEAASPRYSETLKRMREFLKQNPCEPPTKRHKDGCNS